MKIHSLCPVILLGPPSPAFKPTGETETMMKLFRAAASRTTSNRAHAFLVVATALFVAAGSAAIGGPLLAAPRMVAVGRGAVNTLTAATPEEPDCWGAICDGLRLGLISQQPQQALHYGDELTFWLRVYNVSARPLSLHIRSMEGAEYTLLSGNRLRLESGFQGAAALQVSPWAQETAPGGVFHARIIPPGDTPRSAGIAALPLEPGNYILEFPEPLREIDPKDPETSTALRARPGVLRFTVAGGNPRPPADEASAAGIEWGQTLDGLQAGVGLTPGVAQAADDITLTWYLRNQTRQPLTVQYPEYTTGDWMPAVRNSSGEYLPVALTQDLGLIRSTQRKYSRTRWPPCCAPGSSFEKPRLQAPLPSPPLSPRPANTLSRCLRPFRFRVSAGSTCCCRPAG